MHGGRVQNTIVLGLILGTMAIMWWSALVFYYEGEYLSVPQVSVYLLIGAAVSFAYSLRHTGNRDSAERWYLKREEI